MMRFAVIFSFAFALTMLTLAPATAEEAPNTEVQKTAEIVNHLTMNQWVSTTDGGKLSGRVYLPKSGGGADALANVAVAILARDGQVLRGNTNAKGEFTINGVEEGVYALTARGDHVFAACAMHVVNEAKSTELDFPKSAEIAMANIDYTVVNTALIRYLPPNVKRQNVQYDSLDLGQLKSQVCGEDLFRVAQDGSGMKGRLHVAGAKYDKLDSAAMTNVFLFKDAMEIDRTVSDKSGRFNFENIEPGFYSLMAIGQNGIGLIGFELVDPATLETASMPVGADGTQMVGLFGHHRNQCCNCCQEFAMQIAPMPEICSVVEEVVVADPCCGGEVIQGEVIQGEVIQGEIIDGGIVEGEVIMDGFGTPVAGGGFAPGYGGGFGGGYGGGGGFSGGGGGGFFGGGGGLGGLAALAAIPAVIAATSDDDNNAILAPVEASPAVPN